MKSVCSGTTNLHRVFTLARHFLLMLIFLSIADRALRGSIIGVGAET